MLWRPTIPSRTNTQKQCPFHYRGLEWKSQKSRDSWNNRKIWLGVQNEAGQRIIEFCQENALVIGNTLFQQHKRRLYTWTSPDGQYQNQIDYNLCSQRWKSSIQSAKTRPGADSGTDHELLIAKFRPKLKKTRPFMEKAMAPHSSPLAWKIPRAEELGRLQSMGSLSRTRLSDFTFTVHFHALEKAMATHSSVLSWRIPGTGGAWWAAVYGVAQSRTQLKRLSSSSSRPFRYDQN